MNLNEIAAHRSRILGELESKSILLWGAGPHVGAIVDKLKHWGCEDRIVGVFDTTREIGQDEWQGVRVLSRQEVRSKSHDTHVVIACAGLNELYGGIVPEHLFYFRIVHRRALEACFELPGLMDDIQGAVDLLDDDFSKEIYLKRLDLMLSSVMFHEAFKSVGGPYYNNDLVDQLGDRWLYAGAYNGKHLERAMSFRPDQGMVAVEPSARMYQFLQENFGGNPNLELQNYLLWSESGKDIRFVDDSSHQGLAASVFIPEEFGDARAVKTVTIDDLLEGKGVSDIALDVEGSEQHAVAGAAKTIEKYGPRVAVCLYHNLDDFAKLPAQLKSLTGDARMAVRQYSCIPFIENVLYAIPK